MQRVVGITILALITIVALSGCLVEKKDPVLITSTTPNLRVYQPGDQISYAVTAITVSGTGSTRQTGRLTIEWFANADLIHPNTAANVPVLKEVATFSLDGGASDTGTVRYISQDDVTGEVTLHAFRETDTTHYWLSPDDDTALTTIAPAVTFVSPIVIGAVIPQIDYTVLEGCDGNAECNPAIGRYLDNHDVVGNSTEINTSMGRFTNPFQINFSGSSTPSPIPLPITFDIRNVCDTGITQHGDVGDGTMFVMPEIGMIRMDNACKNVIDNETTFYTIEILSTNITLP